MNPSPLTMKDKMKHSMFSSNLLRLISASGLLCLASPAFATTIEFVSDEDSYIRSNQSTTNFDSEQRFLVGYHDSSSLGNLRGLVQFDLSSLSSATISSVTLSFTTVAPTGSGDQVSGIADIELKSLGETFDETTVTWDSLTPNGGDVSGSTLSTITGYDSLVVGGGVEQTFGSTSSFISTVEAARDGSGILSLIVYAPATEDNGLGGGSPPRSFYRFTENATLSVTVIPEPSTYAMLLGTALLGFVAVRRRLIRK